MIQLDGDMLQLWVSGLFVPLTRILAFMAAAPLFSNTSIAAHIKIGLGVLITLIIAPTLGTIKVDLFSTTGVLVLIQQMLIGTAMGFVMRVVFSAIDMFGQMSGLSMGFGFATFFDPESAGQTTVISTFLSLLTMLVFLHLDGHLLMISVMTESFEILPVQLGLGGLNGMQIAKWGATIFSTGLQLALPILAAMLLTNMALGVLTRSAPQLNIFGIGFPITLGTGLIILMLLLPPMVKPLQKLFDQSLSAAHMILRLP